MKKICLLLSLFLLCCLFAGCGKKESFTGYYEILSERQDFYDVSADMNGARSNFLGMQFYNEEPVQLWALPDSNDREKSNIYLYRMNGERELLMNGLTGDFLSSSYSGFLDRKGNLYCFARINSKFVVIKTGPDGKRIYRHEEDKDIILSDICQLEDGRIFLTYSNISTSGVVAVPVELDTDTGSFSDVSTFKYSADLSMGTGGSGLLCLDSNDIYRIDVDSGTQKSIWTFLGTTYVLPSNSSHFYLQLWDFRINEDGCPELFFGGRKGEESFVETLQKVEVGADREIIAVRGLYFGTWITEMTSLFNQQSSDYYVALETCGTYGDWDDYARLTSVEIATGKGPDIFYENVLGEYAWEIAQKGGIVDLVPFLQSSGMEEDDYFPCTFGRWRNGAEIYSISPLIAIRNYYMDGEVLGGNLNPDIEALVNSLLSWQGNAVYRQGMDSLGVLETLLKGSEDIWGAVDWGAGTCDFGSSLFARILEAAKRYGDDPAQNYPELSEYDYYNVYLYKDRTVCEAERLAVVETLFDDGCHPEVYPPHTPTLSINANSVHKAGAWEFLCFLLGNESQEAGTDGGDYPAKKSVFDSWIKKEQEEGMGATTGLEYPEYFEQSGYHYLTDERVEDLKGALESARFLPIKTEPILDIIYEEAQGYFAGQRSIDEITALIENRVQLYLNETR